MAKSATRKKATTSKKKVSKKKVAKKKTTAKKKVASKKTASTKTAAPKKVAKAVVNPADRDEMIAVAAYYRWEQSGRVGELEIEHWLQAEKAIDELMK